jgi:XTP/dITP diphosphohydrolase
VSARPGEQLIAANNVMDRMYRAGLWEAQQTHRSLARYLVEEAYEVLDAIAEDDPAHLREELGDLLLQVLFHARVAQEAGQFTVDDVAAGLVAKLLRRSPHIAADGGEGSPTDIAAQERAWEERKAAEKARSSVLEGIPHSAPPLVRARMVLARAARAGLAEEGAPPELAQSMAAAEAAESELRRKLASYEVRIQMSEKGRRAAT